AYGSLGMATAFPEIIMSLAASTASSATSTAIGTSISPILAFSRSRSLTPPITSPRSISTATATSTSPTSGSSAFGCSRSCRNHSPVLEYGHDYHCKALAVGTIGRPHRAGHAALDRRRGRPVGHEQHLRQYKLGIQFTPA